MRRLRLLPLLLIVSVVSLSAHLKVEKTFPTADSTTTTAPERLQVWFSQAPTLPVSSLTLEGPAGRVALGKIAAGSQDGTPDRSLVAPITGSVAAGAYTVTWKTAGADGHIQTGTFTFTFTPGS